jgi:HEAT repeat protein
VRNALKCKAGFGRIRPVRNNSRNSDSACLGEKFSSWHFWHFIAAWFLFVVLAVGLAAEQPAAEPSEVRDHAWAVLSEGLLHDHASHRVVAVQALSLMSKNRTAERFATRALSDKDAKVRAAAATSLGQLNAYRAIPALRKALEDNQVSVVLASAHSLYLLKDKSAYDIYYAVMMGDRKSNSGLVQAQLDRLKDPKQMMELGFQEGLGFVPFGGMGYQAFKELTRKGGAQARAASARFLAHDPDQISEDALLQTALADKSEEVRLAAIDALAERGNPRSIERLAKNLTEEKTAPRYRTAAAILHLEDIQKAAKK